MVVLAPKSGIELLKKQAFCAVMNSWSFNSMQRDWFMEWVHALRTDYAAPTVEEIERHIDGLYVSVEEEANRALPKERFCTLAFDIWSDGHHHSVLGISTYTIPCGHSASQLSRPHGLSPFEGFVCL